MMNTFSYNQYPSLSRQKGVALFFALIALLLMSLAAVALIRSVDTNTQIAGNLSYRQTANLASSLGQEALSDILGPLQLSVSETNGTGVTPKDPPIGYYATCVNFDNTGAAKCSADKLTDDSNWSGSARKSTYATGTGITGTNGKDAYGNTVQYIVERMCSTVGPSSAANCMLDGTPLNNGPKNDQNKSGFLYILNTTSTPVYRVTVRIDGPKNTVTYMQAFMS